MGAGAASAAAAEPDLGYELTLSLCTAIEDATGEAIGADAGAFHYRGADLRGVVERELYLRLVNHPALAPFYADLRLGRRPAPLAVANALERRVVELACGGELEPGLVEAAAKPAPLRAAAASLRDRLRPTPTLAQRGGRRPGRICVLASGAKFLRFLAPVLDLLDGEELAIVTAVEGVPSAEEAPRGAPVAFLDYAPSVDWRSLGSGLRDRRHLAARFDPLLALLEELGVGALLTLEGNSPIDELGARAAEAAGVASLCLQHGWSPFVHNGFRRLRYGAFLAWGEGFAELLAPTSPGQRFEVTGNPAFDVLAAGGGTDGLAARVAGRPAVAVFLQGRSQLIGQAHLDALVELAGDAARALPEAAVLVREHPAAPLGASAEALAALPNVVLAPPAEVPLGEVVREACAVVSIYSTTLIESAALGRPCVVFNPTSLPRYEPDVERHGIGLETREPAAALEALTRLVRDEAWRASFAPALERFRARFFAGADGRAAERVAAALRAAAASP